MTRSPGTFWVRCLSVRLALAVGLAAFGPAPGLTQMPRELVTRAVTAIGGEQALRNVATVSTEFVSVTFGLGQEETPDSPARATLQNGRTDLDYRASRRSLVQETRPGGATGGATRTRQVVAGGIGLTDLNGTLAPAAPAAVAAALRTLRLQPERLLLQALDAPGTLTRVAARAFRRETLDGARLAAGPDTVTLYFDRPTGRLTVVESLTDDPILGDRSTTTMYTRWTPAGAVSLPRQIDVSVNGRTQSQVVITAATTNAPVADSLFAIPDSIATRARAAASAAAAPAAPVVSLTELAPGVWRAEGGTHHSLVVEQASALIVVEAPQNADRSRAVLDSLRRRFPSKPVAQVVSTHHHWDHSGGVREYMARGIPVVAHARNIGFVQGIGTARKTVRPDALSRSPRNPAVVAVRDSLVVGTGQGEVVLYTLPTAHAEGLLAAYVPAHRLLFTSDVLSPGPTLAAAGSAELVALARSRNLRVDRFAGGHGGVAPWAEVERAAAR